VLIDTILIIKRWRVVLVTDFEEEGVLNCRGQTEFSGSEFGTQGIARDTNIIFESIVTTAEPNCCACQFIKWGKR
jgi:hypothetical protein